MSGARLVKGALAGCIATGPMTVAMLLMHRFLPGEQQYALPPMLITRRLTGGKGPFARLGTHEHKGLTFLTHFGFGTAFGAAYALVPRGGPLPAPLRGILFALCIWTGSYLGWIPAANILPPATRHPAGRNVLMIAAHIVWGALLGILLERLDPDDAPRQEPDFVTPQEGRHYAAARPTTEPAEAARAAIGPVATGSPATATAPAAEPPAGDRVGDDAPPGGGGQDLSGEQQAQG